MENEPAATRRALERRLKEAEAILDALKHHKVDAVIGSKQITLLRLKQVEDQLQEQIRISENRLTEIETIYRSVPVGLCTLDSELRFVRVNEYFSEMSGMPVEDHIGRHVEEIRPELSDRMGDELRKVLTSGKVLMNIELTIRESDPDRRQIWLEHWVPLKDQQGDIVGVNMVVEDITERKRAEEELRVLNATLEERVAERSRIAEDRAEKLRDLALKVSQVEEKERQRLARILHDGIQQLLVGAKFNTGLIRNHLSDPQAILEEVDELDALLDQSIEASRSLSYELSPPVLHDRGLVAAIRWFAALPHMKGLKVDIHVEDGFPTLPESLRTFLFQAVRELLINVIKHAGTDRAAVSLTYRERSVFAEVSDRGRGFRTEKLEAKNIKSLGFRSIQEKLDLMNGEFHVESSPGDGSTVTLRIPSDA